MNQIVIASRNEGKIREIRNFLHGLSTELFSLNDFPDVPAVIEDGRNFEENALKKARIVFEHVKFTTISDDSGLEVDYLKGKPGVHSSRYAGSEATDLQNCQKLLDELKGVEMEDRKARFTCVVALYDPLYHNLVFEGKCDGYIIDEMRGESGFGYDPLFVPAGYTKTFAELDLVTKNKISHRGKALLSLRNFLEKKLQK